MGDVTDEVWDGAEEYANVGPDVSQALGDREDLGDVNDEENWNDSQDTVRQDNSQDETEAQVAGVSSSKKSLETLPLKWGWQRREDLRKEANSLPSTNLLRTGSLKRPRKKLIKSQRLNNFWIQF